MYNSIEHWYMYKEHQRDTLGRKQGRHRMPASVRRVAARFLTGTGTLLYRAGCSLEHMASWKPRSNICAQRRVDTP